MQAVRAPWTTSSFLIYAGGLIGVAALGGFLGAIAGASSKPAFVLWSFLVLVVFDGAAWVLRERKPLVAGLLVVSGVIALAVFVGALESWFGWLSHQSSPWSGFHLGNLIVGAVLLADALFALAVWRFPFLTLIAAASFWWLVTDILSNGGDWTAIVSIATGIVLMLIAIGAPRFYGFWPHFVAGLAVGGALLWFWHSSNLDWILIALASLVYVAVGAALERSSYAVLGALGLFLSWTHFVDKWTNAHPISISLTPPSADHPVWRAVLYGVYALALMVLGVWVARRRGEASPPSA